MSYAPVLGPPPPPEYFEENYGPRLLAISCTLFSIAAVTMILRIYVRVCILKMFGIDDWLMLLAMAAATTTTGFFIKIVTLGMGRHIDFSPVPNPHAFPMVNFTKYFMYLYVYSIIIVIAYSSIKLSIGFFLLRLADRTRWRAFLICTLVFLIAFTIGSAMAIIFQCLPVEAAWDFTLRPPTGPAKCYSNSVFNHIGIFNSSINIATDLLFALLPIPIVWKLQVTLQTKLGLSFCMALGLFATATAIYKTPIQFHFFDEPDFTGNGSWYYIWQQVEMNVGIAAANLPTLKPLLARWVKGLRTSLSANGSRHNRSVLSGTYRSTGYLKQEEGANSFAMDSLSKKSTGDSYGKEWGRGGGKGLDESDECIWRLEHGTGVGRGEMARRESMRNIGGIMRTTDVVITR